MGGLASFLSKSWSKSRLFPSGHYSPFSQTTLGVPGGIHRAGSNFSQAALKEGSIGSSKDSKKHPPGGNNNNNNLAPGGKVALVVDTSPARSRAKGQGLDGGLALAPPLTVEAQGWALSREERQRILTVWDTVFMKVTLPPCGLSYCLMYSPYPTPILPLTKP